MQTMKFALVAMTAAVLCAPAFAQQPVRVTGKYLQKPVNIDVPAMRGVTNVPVYFLAGEQVVQGGGIFDGARGVMSLMADIQGDTTLMQGVVSYRKGDSTYTNRWSGHCVNGKAGGNTTTMCAGDWRMLPGATGVFANMVVSGTWKGVVTPEGNFDAEWDATYTK